MKYFSPIYILFFLLFSCQQEEPLTQSGTGYLDLAALGLQAESHVQVATRAVDADLNIKIISADGQNDKAFRAGDAVLQNKIPLPIGAYTLKAYTDSYEGQAAWTNDDKGQAVYYAESSFTIEEDRVTSCSLQVPMVNYGVKLTLPENFDDWFPTYTFTVEAGGRTVTLQNGETAYFSLPEAGAETPSFTYSLSATNTDGEPFESTEETYNTGIAPGTIYEVNYSLATRSLFLVH